MNRRYYNLSIYRLLAIFLVLQFHILFIVLPTDLGSWSILSKFIQGLTALSGFLLSQKVIDDVKCFYINRAKKIIIPIVVSLLIMILWNILYMFITSNYDFASTFIGYTSSNHRFLLEFGNFYYLIFIVICYLLTPLFKKFKVSKYIVLVLAFALETLSSLFTNPLYIVTSFVVGYLIGERSFNQYVEPEERTKIWRYILWSILLVGSLLLSLYLYKIWWWTSYPPKLILINFALAIFGVSSFFFVALILKWINRISNIGLLNFTDGYTYHVFLFNQAFMCGAMNVSSYVSPFWVKTLLVYLFVIVFSLISYFLCRYLMIMIHKRV